MTDIKLEDAKSSRVKAFFAVVRFLAYARYSILFGAAILGVALLPRWIKSPAVYAVYVLDSPGRMLFTAAISMLAAGLVITTFRTTLCNASARFDDPSASELWKNTPKWLWRVRRFSIWVLGLPVPITCLVLTWNEVPYQFLLVIECMAGVLLGVGLMIAVHWLTNIILTPNLYDSRVFPIHVGGLFGHVPEPERWQKNRISTEAKDRPTKVSLSVVHKLARILAGLGMVDGYVHEIDVWTETSAEPELIEQHLVLRPGHFSLMMLSIVLMGIYVCEYWRVYVFESYPDNEGWFGTLFFLLGILMLLTAILPALAFLLDRYRVPTMVMIGAFALVLGFINPNHEFKFDATDPQLTASASGDTAGEDKSADYLAEPLSLEEVIDGWTKRQNGNRTFVIVTAAGGGIQASGWTTQVLRGLESDVDGGFARSIGLISSVSGGSVGTLFYLAQYPEVIASPTDASGLLDHVHKQATDSSIEAIGWGLLFPDALRCFGLVRDSKYDRGWIQEAVWRKRTTKYQAATDESPLGDGRSAWCFGHLAARVKNGTLPAVVFNTYAIDTGQRVWMAPFRLRDYETEDLKIPSRYPHDFLEYAHAGGMVTRLSTAARLSATFPYVSPTTKPDEMPSNTVTGRYLRNRHFGDGGYTDNEGLLTALHLTKNVAATAAGMASKPIDRILLVRIAPFPVMEGMSNQAYEKWLEQLELDGPIEPGSPTAQGIFGPPIGLYHGRQVTQQERGDVEVEWFKEAFAKEFSLAAAPIAFDNVQLDFYLVDEDKPGSNNPVVAPPLSWKLLARDKENLEKAWNTDRIKSRVQEIKNLLSHSEAVQASSPPSPSGR